MAADVSTMQIKSEAKSGLITRDFLGGCFGIESKELDLDLHVPTGWEKRLDLKSGKVFIQKCKAANSACEERNTTKEKESSPKPNDSSKIKSLIEQPSLNLKLIPINNNNNNNPGSGSGYTSVCTLDKVKSALDRAERASPTSSTTSSSSSSKKRWTMMMSSRSSVRSSSPSNSLSLSIGEEEMRESCCDDQNQGLLVAAACPACLLYVLISKNDPKCPKCNSLVHLPAIIMNKKPKIDLNISI